MLRIEEERLPTGTLTLHLDGQIAGPWVHVLRSVCERELSVSKVLQMSLAGVTFVDQEGLALLRELAIREATLSNCSPFVATQLEGG